MDGVNHRMGDRVKAFDPRTLGVIRDALVVKVGTKYTYLDFGLTGTAKVAHRDVVEVTEPSRSKIVWTPEEGWLDQPR